MNVGVQFRVSFSFILKKKKVLFCRFSGGHTKNLPCCDDYYSCDDYYNHDNYYNCDNFTTLATVKTVTTVTIITTEDFDDGDNCYYCDNRDECITGAAAGSGGCWPSEVSVKIVYCLLSSVTRDSLLS